MCLAGRLGYSAVVRLIVKLHFLVTLPHFPPIGVCFSSRPLFLLFKFFLSSIFNSAFLFLPLYLSLFFFLLLPKFLELQL